jgi:predicted XRE-type DNA-binding protein
MPRSRRPRKTQPSVVDKKIMGKEIATILEDRQLTQTEAAYLIKDSPSQLSLVVNGHLDGFSPERLLRMLTLLGKDVEIRISSGKKGQGKVRVTTH